MVERPPGEITHLYQDDRYEMVREVGHVRDAAVLLAAGITPEGERQVSISISEHETFWKAFLMALKNRCMHGVQLFIRDTRTCRMCNCDHNGPGTAKRAILAMVPWENFRPARSGQARVSLTSERSIHVVGAHLDVPMQTIIMEVAADIRAMSNAPDRKTAKEQLIATIQKKAVLAPRVSA